PIPGPGHLGRRGALLQLPPPGPLRIRWPSSVGPQEEQRLSEGQARRRGHPREPRLSPPPPPWPLHGLPCPLSLPSLAHLSLRNNNIDDQAVLLISQALSSLCSSNKNLVSINLSYNHITDTGATHLANGLRLNRSLLSLSLAHNEIGDEGATKLAEVLGPFALTHTEVVERRRLLLEKEAQERCRLVSGTRWGRTACPLGSGPHGSLPPRHDGASHSEREALLARAPLPPGSGGFAESLATASRFSPLAERQGTEHPSRQRPVFGLFQEPAKKEEKGQASGAPPAQPPAAATAATAQAKKEDAKQSKKGSCWATMLPPPPRVLGFPPRALSSALLSAAVPPVESKAIRGKGTKLSSKDKRSQILEVEQILEPTEMMNPLLEPAEHRDGQVFLQGNRVLIYLNLIRNRITETGLKAFLATVEYQVSRVVPGGKGPTGLLRLSLAKNNFPAESKTYSRIQELMAPRDPLPKAPKAEEELLTAAQ
ncbi:leucine-rich repeat-containing protein 71, partial [Python bivittatus]|uniref:Leucine-rich repeat-containing protein 71 n=1 Tax=Python bivittatus TaxID=176946 RepID=A0A9F5IVX6_PYTBI